MQVCKTKMFNVGDFVKIKPNSLYNDFIKSNSYNKKLKIVEITSNMIRLNHIPFILFKQCELKNVSYTYTIYGERIKLITKNK